MKKKIIGIFICMLLITIILPASASYEKNKNVEGEKVFYPIVKLEWNISEVNWEWINSGFLRGLLSLDEITGNNYGIVSWAKLKVEYGTVNIDPLFRPKFDIVSGDTIKWNFALYTRDMKGEYIWSRYAFGVVIEKAS